MSKFYFILLVNIIIYETATAGGPRKRSPEEKFGQEDDFLQPRDVEIKYFRFDKDFTKQMELIKLNSKDVTDFKKPHHESITEFHSKRGPRQRRSVEGRFPKEGTWPPRL